MGILQLPKQWQIHYRDLTFNLKPFSFKHTGLFPEQAANWDWFSEKIRSAGRPDQGVELLPTPEEPLLRLPLPERTSLTWTLPKAWSHGQRKMLLPPAFRTRRSAGW